AVLEASLQQQLPAVVGGAGAAIGLSVLLWAARRGKAQVDQRTGAMVLRHGPLVRGLALVLTVGIPPLVTALVFIFPPRDAGEVRAIIGIYALFLGLGAPLLWESFRYALVVTPAGLECRSPWRRARRVPWADVSRVTYSRPGCGFVIHAADGWRFLVPLLVP